MLAQFLYFEIKTSGIHMISGFEISIFPCIFCLKGPFMVEKANLSGMENHGQYEGVQL